MGLTAFFLFSSSSSSSLRTVVSWAEVAANELALASLVSLLLLVLLAFEKLELGLRVIFNYQMTPKKYSDVKNSLLD